MNSNNIMDSVFKGEWAGGGGGGEWEAEGVLSHPWAQSLDSARVCKI